MQTYQITIKGTEPLLIDRYIVEEKGIGIRGAKKEHNVEESLYKDDEGLFIPNRMIMWCIKDGAGWVYERPRTTYKNSILGLIQVIPTKIRMNELKWITYTRPVKRKNGERIPKTSPMFEDWGLDFGINKDDSLPIEHLEKILEIAGKRFGMGNFRVGGFGRFKVEKLKEI